MGDIQSRKGPEPIASLKLQTEHLYGQFEAFVARDLAGELLPPPARGWVQGAGKYGYEEAIDPLRTPETTYRNNSPQKETTQRNQPRSESETSQDSHSISMLAYKAAGFVEVGVELSACQS